MNRENLKKIIILEIRRYQIPTKFKPDSKQLDNAADKIYAIFRERSLKITPAYVRKLIESITSIQGDRITSYNVCYTKLLRIPNNIANIPTTAAEIFPALTRPLSLIGIPK